MGLILGWIAIRTSSIWPGMLLHVLHNGLLLCMSHFEDQLKSWSAFADETNHLPLSWLLAGALAMAAGLAMLKWRSRPDGPVVAKLPELTS